MNDKDNLKKIMDDYKQTADTLCNMLDSYLGKPEKEVQEIDKEVHDDKSKCKD